MNKNSELVTKTTFWNTACKEISFVLSPYYPMNPSSEIIVLEKLQFCQDS